MSKYAWLGGFATGALVISGGLMASHPLIGLSLIAVVSIALGALIGHLENKVNERDVETYINTEGVSIDNIFSFSDLGDLPIYIQSFCGPINRVQEMFLAHIGGEQVLVLVEPEEVIEEQEVISQPWER